MPNSTTQRTQAFFAIRILTNALALAMTIIMTNQARAWLMRDPDANTRAELLALINNNDHTEIAKRFAGRLEFGTAGLRAVIGAGPMRMNRLVVRETSAGIANYVKQSSSNNMRVVIGFDGRRLSREFALDTACVFGALGFTAQLFDHEVPTPLVAYAVQATHACLGVMVTASHNPPEYNGYKVYWGNGAQIIPPHDVGMAAAIENAASQEIPWEDADSLRANGRLQSVPKKIVEDYLRGVASLSIHPKSVSRQEMDIAYTPLHGVGAIIAEAALAQAGFTRVHTVATQREPDAQFPTVAFPNPEEPGAMDAVLALARQNKAEIACANDPDADRFAAAVRTPNGDYQVLTGNEIGILLADDQLRQAPANACVGTTIVSSRLLRRLAAHYQAAYFETLTGFKWLANEALERQKQDQQLIFAYEEALGYTIGELVRDKDGISALVAFAELAAHLRDAKQSVLTRLESIYRQHGLFVTGQKTLTLSGANNELTRQLRATLPSHIAGRRVIDTQDLLQPQKGRTFLPSDVLIFDLEGDARVIIRPSGTEPKIKCYYEICEACAAEESFANAQARAHSSLLKLMDIHQRELISP